MNTPKQKAEAITKLWDKHGKATYIRALPQIKEVLSKLPLNPDDSQRSQAIVQVASLAVARAYRLGFKIGAAMEMEEKINKQIIITKVNLN